MYIVYLDEFGHIGPYISKNDPRHNNHPVFGLAGFAIPAHNARKLSSHFFNIKKKFFSKKIIASGKKCYEFEEKSSNFFRNNQFNGSSKIKREKTNIINRILSKISDLDGFVIYVGIEKHLSPDEFKSKGLYKQVVKEVIKRIDEEMNEKRKSFLLVMDQQSDFTQNSPVPVNDMRREIVRQASMTMFGEDKKLNLVEPPIQVESHLYPNVQIADWICGLIGKISFYDHDKSCEKSRQKTKVFKELFEGRIKIASKRSGIRKVKISPKSESTEIL